MKRTLLATTLAATVALSACATNPYGYNDPYNQGYNNGGYTTDSQGRRVATGAAVGGVVGLEAEFLEDVGFDAANRPRIVDDEGAHLGLARGERT
jgi:hypothetical protein